MKHRSQYRNKINLALSHTESAHILSDVHGFWVNRNDEAQDSSTQAFVGKNLQGEIVYFEFGIGAGDHYAVSFVRKASEEEIAFYIKGFEP